MGRDAENKDSCGDWGGLVSFVCSPGCEMRWEHPGTSTVTCSPVNDSDSGHRRHRMESIGEGGAVSTVGLNGGLKNVPPLPTEEAPLTLPLPLILPPLTLPLALALPYPSPPYSMPEYGATYSGKSTVPSLVIHHHFRFGWMNVLASRRIGVRASSTTILAILRASCWLCVVFDHFLVLIFSSRWSVI